MSKAAIITRHASKRSRERLALKPASVLRMAEMALEHGITVNDTAGALHRWLRAKESAHPATHLRIYGEVVFVFGMKNEVVSVWPLKHEFKSCAAKIRSAKRVRDEEGCE